MLKDSSDKHYQRNKERLQKMASERYQRKSEEEKRKNENMVTNDIKIFLRMKKYYKILKNK